MIRPLFILLLSTTILNESFGQITISEKEIFDSIVNNSKTCDKAYLTDKTDTLFIKEFQKAIKQKDNWIFENGKLHKISFTKSDKATLLKELDACKKFKWTDTATFPNTRIIPLDSIFKVDYYIDSFCLAQLMTSKNNSKTLSLSKPMFIDSGNSFVVYTIEIGVLLKSKRFYYANTKLTLYKKTTDNKWIKVGNLFPIYACNG